MREKRTRAGVANKAIQNTTKISSFFGSFTYKKGDKKKKRGGTFKIKRIFHLECGCLGFTSL